MCGGNVAHDVKCLVFACCRRRACQFGSTNSNVWSASENSATNAWNVNNNGNVNNNNKYNAYGVCPVGDCVDGFASLVIRQIFLP